VVLLVRLLGEVVPELATRWMPLLMAISVVSIFYGSLCAIPQRSLRRLLGYSSIANGGFVLLGVAAFSKAGSAAVLFYLAAYLFAVLAAFLVVAVVVQKVGSDDLGALAGLHRRAPLLAVALTFSMVSLAGVPPLAGFMGKFVILQALVERGADLTLWYAVAAVALIGVVISFWYYFGVLKAVYWPAPAVEGPGLVLSPLLRATLYACLAGLIILGVYPGPVWEAAMAAVQGLRL
jgi:NADH-quinone oxidoreductase subunit N